MISVSIHNICVCVCVSKSLVLFYRRNHCFLVIKYLRKQAKQFEISDLITWNLSFCKDQLYRFNVDFHNLVDSFLLLQLQNTHVG